MHSVLIVEDESTVALEIAMELQSIGMEVIDQIDNGKEAIECAKSRQPDVILMDIHIKGDIDGVETAKRIRKHCGMPIIFLTGAMDNEKLERAMELYPFAYLPKPYGRENLHFQVKIALSSTRTKTQENDMIDLGNEYRFHSPSRSLYKGDELVPLDNKPLCLLELLIRRRGQIVPTSVIDEEIWPEKGVATTTRRTLLRKLRKQSGNINIITKRGQGLMLP